MPSYPFQKRVRFERLQSELRAALGVGVVAYINGSEEVPFAGVIVTTRDLSPAEVTTGQQVIQAHDYTEPEGDALSYKQLRAQAAPLIGRTFQSLTLAELRTVVAVLAVRDGIVGPGGVLRLPPSE